MRPTASRSETLKSSICTSTPETAGARRGVTVTVIALAGGPAAAPRPRPVRGNRKRCWRSTGVSRPPMPARLPVAPWQVLHLPSPLK